MRLVVETIISFPKNGSLYRITHTQYIIGQLSIFFVSPPTFTTSTFLNGVVDSKVMIQLGFRIFLDNILEHWRCQRA